MEQNINPIRQNGVAPSLRANFIPSHNRFAPHWEIVAALDYSPVIEKQNISRDVIDRILGIFIAITDLEASVIISESKLFESLDEFQSLILFAAIEETFQIHLSIQDVSDNPFSSLSDIAAVTLMKLAQKEDARKQCGFQNQSIIGAKK